MTENNNEESNYVYEPPENLKGEASQEDDFDVALSRLKNTKNKTTIIETTRYRWVITFSMLLLLFSNGTAYSFFSPVMNILSQTYEKQLWEVNMTVVVYLIVYAPMTFVSNYVIDKMGCFVSVICGGSLLIGGLWMRLLVNHNFWYLIGGCIVSAIGQPLLYNLPPKISAKWFPTNQRTLATTIGALSSPIGSSLGMLWPTMFIESEFHSKDRDLIKDQVYNAFQFEAIWLTIMVGIGILLFRDKPKHPPSKSAAKSLITESQLSVKESLKCLAKNGNFWLINLDYICIMVVMNTCAANLAPILVPFGFGSQISAFVGLAFLASGLIGAAAHGYYVGKHKKYKNSMNIICIGAAIALFAFIWLLKLGHPSLPIIAGFLLGFSILPGMSVSLEYGCEVTYPVGEGTLAGLMIASAQIASAAFVLSSGVILDGASQNTDMIFGLAMAYMMIVACICGLLTNEDLRRLRADQRKTTFLYSSVMQVSMIAAPPH